MAYSGKQVYHGNHGRLWIDAEQVEIVNVSAQISLEREDVRFNGDEYSDSIVTGKTGKGKFTIKHMGKNTPSGKSLVSKFLSSYKNGGDSRFIVVILENNGNGQPIRWSIKDCWLTGDIPIADVEQDNITNKEFNFGFRGDPIEG